MTDTSDPIALPTARKRAFDVVCVGSALMDHLGFASLETLAELGFEPGAMTLADVATTERIAARVGADRQVSGGAEANTAVGVASFGATSAFVGAIGDDRLGERYAVDLQAAGVRAVLQRIAPDGNPETSTGRCFVLVTPDSERTMVTALGASGRLDHEMIDTALMSSAEVVYFDAYVFDFADGEQIVARILEGARAAKTTIAFGLADPFAVLRHREAINALLEEPVDLVFANESEALSLTGAVEPTEAIVSLRVPGLIAVVTRGARGAVIVTNTEEIEVPAVVVPEIVDVTGAGDLFSAGVLFGVARRLDLLTCAHLGALAASEVIGHLGARPETSLADLASRNGLV